MSNIEQAQDCKPRPSIRRFAGIVAVFVLLGPPAGELAVPGWLAAVTASSDLVVGGMSGWLGVFSGAAIFGAAFGLLLSYVAGIVPASVIGFATAAWDARNGAVSVHVAPGGISEGDGIGQVAMVLAHLVAAGLCWLVTLVIFGRAVGLNRSEREDNR